MTETVAPRITVCPDGPLLIRGEVDVIGDDGRPIRNPRRTIALCRCGASGIKPWCDGTHKLVRFTSAEHPPPASDDAAARTSTP